MINKLFESNVAITQGKKKKKISVLKIILRIFQKLKQKYNAKTKIIIF